MMKRWILLGFLFSVCFNFLIAQNNQLKEDIEMHILEIDSLKDGAYVYHGSLYLGKKNFLGIRYNFKRGGGGEWKHYVLTPSDSTEKEQMEVIFYEYFFRTKHKITKVERYSHIKEYYREGKLIFLKRERGKSKFLQKNKDHKVSNMLLYISEDNVIYYEKNGKIENERKIKAFIKKKYNVKF